MNFEIKCHCERVKRAWQSIVNSTNGLLRHYAPRNDVKRAFTLAEVLITLTIIGVIAALTIPNLMQKWSDHADVVKVKEAYSILGNALRMAVAENGPIDSWEFPDTSDGNKNTEFFGEKISKYLKLHKYCGTNDGCFSYGWQADGGHSTNVAGYYKTLSGGIDTVVNMEYNNSATRRAKMVLANGMNVSINARDLYLDNGLGKITVDINGKSKPNRLGYDIFQFGIYGNKLIPNINWNTSDYCKPNGRFANDYARDGIACAYWVMRKDNVDYKYRDISAEW